jgi:rifampicin phosphotransferase
MEIGNKGLGLYKISESDIYVPCFSVLGKDFFVRFLKEVKAYETAQLLSMENGWVQKKFECIKKMILESDIGNEIIEEIYELTKNLKFPIAVRSSASTEDRSNRSSAGLYYSSLNVQKDNLIAEIRKVLASLYDEKCIVLLNAQDMHPDSYYMGIVIQEMVDSEWSGISFTADPNTGDPSFIHVDMALGLGDKIVSGITETESFLIPKDGNIENVNILGKNFLDEMKAICLKAEDVFERPVDIEWAYSQGKIFVLQCRPITTINKKQYFNKIELFSISQLSSEVYPYLGFLQKRYSKWVKKANLFNFCEKNKIRTNKWKLISFTEELIEKYDFSKVFENFESNYIMWTINGQTSSFDYANNIFVKIKEFMNVYKENSYCVSLREILPNELSAISSVNEDGTVKIECIHGRMYHLKSGIVTPTSYTLDHNGKVININLEEQEKFCYGEDSIVSTGKKITAQLSDRQISEIYKSTKKLTEQFGKCAPEWWIWDEKVYIVDISILNTNESNKNNTIISKGKVKGRLFQLPVYSQDVIDKLSSFNVISVSNVDFDVDRIDLLHKLKEEIIKESKGENVILYSERPYIFLSPFIEFVSGFIFKSASNLCHLSLILRENGIPAISLNGKNIGHKVDSEFFELDAEEGVIRPM